jgi:hypothetical protein
VKGWKERHKIAEERRGSLLEEFLRYEYSYTLPSTAIIVHYSSLPDRKKPFQFF